jgi:NAD(P)-dependent dehydrogenase (short-subunit alcohol dehydrogenase family)
MDAVYTQLFFRPPVPVADFTGKTIIITGANTGIGKEAVKHFVRLNASKVIATARSDTKCVSSLAEVEKSTERPGVVEFWTLDYSSYDSVKAFCKRAETLKRVDAAVLNAGLGIGHFEKFEGDESSVVVNVISTTLLMLLLLPILRQSATKWGIVPTLSVTGSAYYSIAKFPERSADNSLEALCCSTSMGERQVGKMSKSQILSRRLTLKIDIKPLNSSNISQCVN